VKRLGRQLKRLPGLLKKIPAKYRRPAYIVWAIGSLVLIYLKANGHRVGDELALWNGVGSVLGFTAAANVVSLKPTARGKHAKEA